AMCTKNLEKPIINQDGKLDKIRQQDFKLHATHMIYAGKVKDVAVFRKQVRLLMSKLNAIKEKLDNGNEELKKIDKDIEDIRKELSQVPANLTLVIETSINQLKRRRIEVYTQKIEPHKRGYCDCLRELSQALLAQQKAIIISCLFAHEAYINYGAVYHTVEWQQSANTDLRIDRRLIVLGSLLQQIGFRLLHAKHYAEQGAPINEVSYRVSKYEQRIADMIWGPQLRWFDDEFFDKTRTQNVLSRLKPLYPINPNVFNEKLYILLNRGIKLVKIKKDNNIQVYEKGEKAFFECLKHYLTEEEGMPIHSMNDQDILALCTAERKGRLMYRLTRLDSKQLTNVVQKIILLVLEVKLDVATDKWSKTKHTPNNILLWGQPFKAIEDKSETPSEIYIKNII
ncbi:MAG: hypothetical protein ACK4PR_12055, partial [Gammaproteobacteria bacterium]